MNKADEKKINVFQNRCLRRMMVSRKTRSAIECYGNDVNCGNTNEMKM